MVASELFAVSIVYSRSEELKWIVDEEGMIVGAAPRIGISCVTGYALAETREIAVSEVRAGNKNVFQGSDGWVEQFSHSQHVPLGRFVRLTAARIKYYWRRIRLAVSL